MSATAEDHQSSAFHTVFSQHLLLPHPCLILWCSHTACNTYTVKHTHVCTKVSRKTVIPECYSQEVDGTSFMHFIHMNALILTITLEVGTTIIPTETYIQFEQAPGVGDGQGGLVCCSPWDGKQSYMTELLNWTEWFIVLQMGFPGRSVDREYPRNAGDEGSIPGPGRSPGEGNGNPLQYSYLENSMNKGTWQSMESWEPNTTEWLNQIPTWCHWIVHFKIV